MSILTQVFQEPRKMPAIPFMGTRRTVGFAPRKVFFGEAYNRNGIFHTVDCTRPLDRSPAIAIIGGLAYQNDMNEKEAKKILDKQIKEAGSQKAWAKAKGFSKQYANDLAKGRRTLLSKKVLDVLGLEIDYVDKK